MTNKEKPKYSIMIFIIAIIGITCMLLGALFSQNPAAWGKGVFFGTVFTIIKWVLMKNTITKAVTMPEARARSYTALHYVFRYLLTAVALLVGALEPSISLMGVFGGLLTMKIATYVLLLLGKTDSVL